MTGKVQILDFHLDERHFGLALVQVQRVVRAVDITPLPQAPGIILGVISLHGIIVPVLNVRVRFGFPQREVDINDQFIIANTRGRTVALVVSGVKGIIEYPADKIVATEKFLHPTRQVEGLIQLEDGLVLIHDLDRFLSLDEVRELERGLSANLPADLLGQPNHGS
jgi:purine-binding chemotaxis protein CheW